ncbi:hypothetical protein EKO27_g7150 [Xylaria grammica]|uniref:Uncharacterized protein n=1 Tax=Xylaria grammica TaxID=363999 RepID=A0A439D0G4_9PEZI|nr:hypothetical protein EKO27_g7150 [Xylaria grammica]
MEAFGLGANVAAFVVIAAQLSKVLYTTFSSIKDGPDNARKVAAHLLQLHGVLEQLRHSSLASQDTALVGHVGLCVSDLNSLADDVQKLQLTPDEARTGRLWKRFKSFLDEKKLDRICDQIVAHTGTLSLRLSIVNSNTTYELMSGTRATNQLINDLSGDIVEQTDSLVSKFGDVESTLHTQHDKLQKGLTSIQAAVSDVSHMSQTKADSMLELLLEIKNSIVNPNSSTCQRKTVTDNAPEQMSQSNNEEVEADTANKPSLDADLVRSITRLCRLIKEKDQSFDTNEEDNTQAEDIIEDLQTLVGSAQRYGNTTSSIVKKGATDKRDLRSDLRRFSQSFGQFKLLLNEENRRENGPSSTTIQQKRTYTRVFLKGLGTLSLMVTKKTGASSAGEESSTMVLSFLPEDLQQFTMIVASTTQRKMPSGPAPPISRLAVNRVLPAGSRVFNVVEKGLLQELQAMLRNNEATLRDHDEYGASLLFYAIYGQKTEMCRFLLENGADIDHVASTRGLAWGRTDDPRLLLDWGADPTAHMPGTTSFFEFAINCGRHEAIRFVYSSKLIKAFVGTDNSVPDKTQSLFNACTAFNYGDITERIRKFLDAGANVNLRNGKGHSCLHFRAIKLLIERGADVYAVDLSGKSVSELAYVSMNGYHLGDGFVGDLWDAVLHDCGYDIAIFRKNHQRKPSYGGHYSRKHLEMLWEGKGDQCPYWNDAVWPADAASHPPLEGREAEDNNERAKDISSSDEPGESPGSFCLGTDDDGVSMRNDWCWRGQSALETAEEIDSHAIPEFSEAETEPASPIRWHVNVGETKSNDGTILTGGNKLSLKNGFLFGPTIISNATRSMKLASGETFGLLLVLFPFYTEYTSFLSRVALLDAPRQILRQRDAESKCTRRSRCVRAIQHLSTPRPWGSNSTSEIASAPRRSNFEQMLSYLEKKDQQHQAREASGDDATTSSNNLKFSLGSASPFRPCDISFPLPLPLDDENNKPYGAGMWHGDGTDFDELTPGLDGMNPSDISAITDILPQYPSPLGFSSDKTSAPSTSDFEEWRIEISRIDISKNIPRQGRIVSGLRDPSVAIDVESRFCIPTRDATFEVNDDRWLLLEALLSHRDQGKV